MRKILFSGSIIVTLILCGLIFFRLFFTPHEPFPRLPDGSYLGYFSADLIGTENQNAFFSVQVNPNSHTDLELTIYDSAWGPRSFDINKNIDNQIALIVTEQLATDKIGAEPQAVLRFGGRQISQNLYSGAVTNVSTGKRSTWFLFSDNSSKMLNELDSNYRQLPALMAERAVLERQIAYQRDRSDLVLKERDRLVKVLSEEKLLEQKGESRFNEKQIEIEKLRAEIALTEDALNNIQSALNIARSITPKGRLSTISREILSREYREINSRTLVGKQEDARLLAELAMAKEALALKRELSSQASADPVQISREAP